MHPNAARLALHGFVLCRHKGRPEGWRIKRQGCPYEDMLVRGNEYPGTAWKISSAAKPCEYEVVSWDSINSLILGDLPEALIIAFIEQA